MKVTKMHSQFSQSGREYRVSKIEAVRQDGNWYSVELRGHVLKKDGTEGLNPASERLYGEHPDWLKELLKGLA